MCLRERREEAAGKERGGESVSACLERGEEQGLRMREEGRAGDEAESERGLWIRMERRVCSHHREHVKQCYSAS